MSWRVAGHKKRNGSADSSDYGGGRCADHKKALNTWQQMS